MEGLKEGYKVRCIKGIGGMKSHNGERSIGIVCKITPRLVYVQCPMTGALVVVVQHSFDEHFTLA